MFFRAVNLNDKSNPFKCPPYMVSFHLPLHRQLATVLLRALSLGGKFLEAVQNAIQIESPLFLRRALLHPLRIQVVIFLLIKFSERI